MTRETRTKTSQSGSPRSFAIVNKFSILAPDDNHFTCEGCTPLHTSRSQRCRRVHECRRGDGRVDECITAPETTFSSHQGFGTSKLNVYQVPYLAASGGDSKGVHHVSGFGWRRLSAIMDWGSAECVIEVGADIASLHGQVILLIEAESLQRRSKMTKT